MEWLCGWSGFPVAAGGPPGQPLPPANLPWLLRSPPAAPPARPSALPKKSRAAIRALAAELRHAHLKPFAAAFAARLGQAGPGEYHLGAAGVLARP